MKDLIDNEILGIGVIGNFAHHLEQAGEADSFCDIDAPGDAPKGVFAFYVPNHPEFGRFCFNNDEIMLPNDTGAHVQAEAEVGLFCDLEYKDGQVHEIIPRFFSAFNDVSLRNGEGKLANKKNFSTACKATGAKIKLDKFDKNGICDKFSIISYIKLQSTSDLQPYGPDARLISYSYFYTTLISWLKDKLNNQKESKNLHNINELIKGANYPKRAVIAVGATKYCDLGQNHFLAEGDEIYICVFNHEKYSELEIKEFLSKNAPENANFSFIKQIVKR
ncbi:MAG: DUF5718 family protein [Helicobacter sp.]|nr:DUF5718 family protein [Helicobacter sp.]